jgi:hypothetical protein
MWDLWWTKRNWDKFSPSTTASLAKHFTYCSTYHHHHHPDLIKYVGSSFSKSRLGSIPPRKELYAPRIATKFVLNCFKVKPVLMLKNVIPDFESPYMYFYITLSLGLSLHPYYQIAFDHGFKGDIIVA